MSSDSGHRWGEIEPDEYVHVDDRENWQVCNVNLGGCGIIAYMNCKHWPAVKVSPCVAAAGRVEKECSSCHKPVKENGACGCDYFSDPPRAEMPGELEMDGIENWGTKGFRRETVRRLNALRAVVGEQGNVLDQTHDFAHVEIKGIMDVLVGLSARLDALAADVERLKESKEGDGQ